MFNEYEETMPLVTNEDEYKKYLIDESLPLFDKLNLIIKKGYPFQRQALINTLDLYIDNSLFQPLIQYIIAEIETWDIETHLHFPKCLHKILINNLSSINNQLFNIILKHMILSISSGNEKVCKEYIFYFDIIIENYTKRFNSGETFTYEIGDDIFEIISSLGKFGQSPENIRLCCYLSSCICRLVGHVEENENIQKMFNRICLLFGDLEKTTERQISRELRYLIPIFKEKILEKNDIIKAIKSYINHDWDHAIQTTTIVSLMVNFEFINQEMKELIFDKIGEIFEDINYEEEHKNNIIESCINMLYNQCIVYDQKKKEKKSNNYMDYELNDLINNILQMNFMKNFLYKNKIEPLLIISFNKINTIFQHSSLYNYNNDNNSNQPSNYLHNYNFEEGITIENIFFHIFSKIFPKTNNNSESNNGLNENINENLKKLFLINLYNMIPCFNNFKFTKYLCEKLGNLFKKDSILQILNIYENEFTLNNFSKNHNYLYKFLYSILEKGYKNIRNINSSHNKNSFLNNNSYSNNANAITILLNENNCIFKLFQNLLENIFLIYKTSPKSITCQIHALLAKTLQKLIKLIYKYYKPYSQYNKEKNSADKLYNDIFNEYLINIIKSEDIGNHIKIEYINVIPYLILYGKNRQEYYNFVEDEIMKSNQFFTRRCSINFIEKCLNLYSFKLFLKFHFMEIIFYLINDENSIISSSIIEKIFLYHKKIKLYSNNTFDKICSILSEINILNKDNNIVKDFDIEKNRIIQKILNLNNTSNKNKNNKKEKNHNCFEQEESEEEKEIKKIKAKETKHIKKENDILGKAYQTISLIITVKSIKKISNEKADSKFESENKNEILNNNHNDDVNQNSITQKERTKKRKMILEKSVSTIFQNVSNKTTAKKYLPKLKQFHRKKSIDNTRPFNINLFNNNNLNYDNANQKNNKSLNFGKLMVVIKEKTPEKKSHLRAINNRLPSANQSKTRDMIVNNSANLKQKHLILIQNKLENNILIDDTSYQIININGFNKSNNMPSIVGYTGKDFIKEIIKNNIANNKEKKENKLNNSCKKVAVFLKQRIKGIKLKRESYFNTMNKISINAKMSEVNKSNK